MRLDVINISYSYNETTPILKNVSLSVNTGEIVGLVAPSGYGKTTLARIIAGYIKQDDGHVLLDFKDTSLNKGFNQIQIAHQHPEKAIDIHFKVNQILNEGWEVNQELKDAFGIESFWLDKWPTELSGGELQRVCLARLLRDDVKFLIADEITASVDAITQVEIWSTLKKLTQTQDLGILMISHDEELLKHVADRIIDLREINKISSPVDENIKTDDNKPKNKYRYFDIDNFKKIFK